MQKLNWVNKVLNYIAPDGESRASDSLKGRLFNNGMVEVYNFYTQSVDEMIHCKHSNVTFSFNTGYYYIRGNEVVRISDERVVYKS